MKRGSRDLAADLRALVAPVGGVLGRAVDGAAGTSRADTTSTLAAQVVPPVLAASLESGLRGLGPAATARASWLRRMGRAVLRVDVAVFRWATARPAHRLDAVLYPLSRAADHSKLWLGSAALMALRGDRRSRRAALRGVVSIGASSLFANAVLKPIFVRARPVSVASPWLTRVARMPTSAAFPSGHAASATAFTVGVGMEWPAAAVPLGTMAAAVAASRVRTRVHYPLDVAVGAAVGAGMAWATSKVWAVPPGTPARAVPVRTRADRLAAPDGAGLTVVVNPAAGSDRRSVAEELQEALPAGTVVVVDQPDELVATLERAAEGRAMGVAGGDGSVNAASHVALRVGLPLAVVPGGTLNHFARDLGLSSVADTVAAVKAGDLAAVDVGMIDGRPFLNTASFASYAGLVDAREQLEDHIGKWLALAVGLVRVLRSGQPVDIELNGQPVSVWMIFIGNCVYEPPGLAPGWRERLDDGLFDVRYVEAGSPWCRSRLVVALLTGQLGRSKVYRRKVVRSLEVRSSGGPLRLACDGETFDASGDGFSVEKHPSRLVVYARFAD